MNKSHYFFYAFLCSISMHAMIDQKEKNTANKKKEISTYFNSNLQVDVRYKGGQINSESWQSWIPKQQVESVLKSLDSNNITYQKTANFMNKERTISIIQGIQLPLDLSYFCLKDYENQNFQFQVYCAYLTSPYKKNNFVINQDARMLFGIYHNQSRRFGVLLEMTMSCACKDMPNVISKFYKQCVNNRKKHEILLHNIENFLAQQNCSEMRIHGCARASTDGWFIDQKYFNDVFWKKSLQ